MNNTVKLAWNVARWLLVLLGALLFAYGFAGGRWDAAVLGLLFIIFGVAISLKLSILAIKAVPAGPPAGRAGRQEKVG